MLSIVSHATRRRDFAKVISKFQRVHMKRVREANTHITVIECFRRKTRVTNYGLCRDRFGERERPITRQPVHCRCIDGSRTIAAKRVVVRLALSVQPVDVFDGLLVGSVDAFHELDFVDANGREYVVDTRDGRLTNANARHIRRLDQADFDRALPLAIQDRIQIGRRHPAGRATADNQNTFGLHCFVILCEVG